MINKLTTRSAALLSCITLASCGGGGNSSTSVVTDPNDARMTAAVDTAVKNPLCKAISPFYWEIGDQSGVLVSGSVGTKSDGNAWKRTDVMSIASSSKWLYGAYAVEVKGGSLSETNAV